MGAVDRITHQGMAEMGEVNADLMGAAGLKAAGDERRDSFTVVTAEDFPHFIMGDGFASAVAHRHLFPRMGMTIDRRIDGAVRPAELPPDQGKIAPLH